MELKQKGFRRQLDNYLEGNSYEFNKGYLFIDVHDIQSRGVFPLKEDQAIEILDFYFDVVKSSGVKLLYTHCHAGVGRSPAIAAALDVIDGQEAWPWFRRYQSMNRNIFKTLLDVYKEEYQHA